MTVPVGAALPGAPQNLSAAIGDGRVTLCWDPPVSDDGQPILRYRYTWHETVVGGA